MNEALELGIGGNDVTPGWEVVVCMALDEICWQSS